LPTFFFCFFHYNRSAADHSAKFYDFGAAPGKQPRGKWRKNQFDSALLAIPLGIVTAQMISVFLAVIQAETIANESHTEEKCHLGHKELYVPNI